MYKKKDPTSWEPVSCWYDQTVGEEGHYYHRNLILPKIVSWIPPLKGVSVLDLACGEGILSRALPKQTTYVGLDIAPSLIAAAKKKCQLPHRLFSVADITISPLPIKEKQFDFCTIILALQNIQNPQAALHNAYCHLKPEGQLIIVMNHPCFRIPKYSFWGVDHTKNIQYRRIDHYMSPLEIPIQSHPSQGAASIETPSFHMPLSHLAKMLYSTGFCIVNIEEWCSDKKSTGKHAIREDVSRREIPLFLTIIAYKRSI